MAHLDTKYGSIAMATNEDTVPQQAHTLLKLASRRKAFGLIVFNFVLVALPGIAFSVVVLCLVFFRRPDAYSGIDLEIFPQDRIDDSDVFFVDIESATLVYVASWSSTIANLLTGCIVVLLQYSLAAAFQQRCENGIFGATTAPQALLLVQLFAGQKLNVFRSWLSHTFKRRGNGAIAHLATLGLSIALFVAALIVAADAYLHLSTKSVTFTDATLPTVPWSKGYALRADCTKGNNSYYAQAENTCVLVPSEGTSPPLFVGDMTIVHNESLLTTVYKYSSAISESNATSDHFAYVGAPNLPSYVDFVANTFAASTECRIVTPSCRSNATALGTIASFDCGPEYPAFRAPNMTAEGYLLFSFRDESASSEDNGIGSIPDRPKPNAFTWGMASSQNSVGLGSIISSLDPGQQAFEFNLHELFFILCSTSVWNATYTFYNGSVVPESWNVEAANNSMSNMVASGMYLQFVGDTLSNLLSQSTSNSAIPTVQDAVSLFASRASAFMLSVATAGMEWRDPIAEQERTNRVVTKVRKDAIYYFVAANLLMTLLGSVVFLAALVALVLKGRDVCEIVQQLNIEGIVHAAARRESAPQERNDM